ncbi:ribonuclease H family protein, partial [Mycobacterium kansasii]
MLVESDSKLVVDWLNNISKVGWKMHHWVARILSLNLKGSFRFAHTFRQGNMPADALARLGSST